MSLIDSEWIQSFVSFAYASNSQSSNTKEAYLRDIQQFAKYFDEEHITSFDSRKANKTRKEIKRYLKTHKIPIGTGLRERLAWF